MRLGQGGQKGKAKETRKRKQSASAVTTSDASGRGNSGCPRTATTSVLFASLLLLLEPLFSLHLRILVHGVVEQLLEHEQRRARE